MKIAPGLRLEKLLILEEVERKLGRDRRYRCRCDCGKELVDTACHLRKRTSCGGHSCRKKRSDSNGGFAAKDKSKRIPEYKIWCDMRKRCRNNSRYVAKGIKVCPRWDDFKAFLEDMGRRPTPQHSIDRIDNDGDYTPENCRWATARQQAENRGGFNVILTFQGRAQLVSQWSAETGLPQKLIQNRINLGWAPERILTTPPRADRRRVTPIEFTSPSR